MSFEHVRLGALADVIVSNVDKHSVEGQPPVRLCNYTDVYYEHTLDQSRQYMTATASPDQIKKFRLQVDDVIITKDSETADDIGIPALVTETADDFVCGYHLAILRPNPQKADGRYLNWTLQSGDLQAQFENIAFGVTRVGLKTGRIKTLEIPIPGGPVEQVRIADYLDRETATIDALIEKQQSLRNLLKTRRSLAIDAALEKTWNSMPGTSIKALTLTQGLVDGDWVESKDQDPNGRVRLTQLADVGDGVFRDRSERWVNDETFKRLRCFAILPGDILIARMPDPIGRACIVPELPYKAITVVDVAILRTTQNVDARYLTYVLNGSRVRGSFEALQDGATRQRITRKKLDRTLVPVPSLDEQREIADRLDRETAKIDALIAKAERFIELAQERRAALITAAVTGQIEIPTED